MRGISFWSGDRPEPFANAERAALSASDATPPVSRPNADEPRIVILLGTHQGERFLAEQLDSFAAQTHKNWYLRVSDDGSTDGTMHILRQYQRAWPNRIEIAAGPCKGFARNYLSLLRGASRAAEFYAFSDQDDIWHADKLERAVRWLSQQPAEVPALYCGRTRLVNEQAQPIGFSSLFKRSPGFSNALVQSLGGANTMAFNAATHKLVCQVGTDIDVASHDWWLYILVSGVGGHLLHDTQPAVDYRQHPYSLVGSNLGWQARIKRLRMLNAGYFREWNSRHLKLCSTFESILTEENKKIMEYFCQARQAAFPARLWYASRSGIFRQTTIGNIGLLIAVIFNKI